MDTVLLVITDIPWKKIGAIIIILFLVFNAGYKEDFLFNKEEHKYLAKISAMTGNKISGRMVIAIFWFLIILITGASAFFFYG